MWTFLGGIAAVQADDRGTYSTQGALAALAEDQGSTPSNHL